MTKKTMYFAHTMPDYHTEREQQAIYTITGEHGYDIINPSDPMHSAAADAFKRAKMNAMDYFLALVRGADALAFMRTNWGEIGPGVAKEIIEASCFGKPIFEVTPVRLLAKPTAGHVFSDSIIVTIDDMRERIKNRFQPPKAIEKQEEEIPF